MHIFEQTYSVYSSVSLIIAYSFNYSKLGLDDRFQDVREFGTSYWSNNIFLQLARTEVLAELTIIVMRFRFAMK